MDIHEYQAKALLREFGVPVPEGYVVSSPSEATGAARKLRGPPYAIKSQIHSGGRGRGCFKELWTEAGGGIRIAASIEDVARHAAQMLGKTLVTSQTGPAGELVRRLYVEECVEIERELYLAVTVDHQSGQIAFVASGEGGTDIEAVARASPDKIVQVPIDGATDSALNDARTVAHALGLEGNLARQAGDLAGRLYAAFVAKDMTLLEINPLVVSKSGELKCLDAKITLDANALHRHPELVGRSCDEI